MATDYIHDNCELGKTERFNLFCNLLLAPDTYDRLYDICDELGGQLSWFESTQEFDHLSHRLWEYHPLDFNGRLWTGRIALWLTT